MNYVLEANDQVLDRSVTREDPSMLPRPSKRYAEGGMSYLITATSSTYRRCRDDKIAIFFSRVSYPTASV